MRDGQICCAGYHSFRPSGHPEAKAELKRCCHIRRIFLIRVHHGTLDMMHLNQNSYRILGMKEEN
jgi:hypothetical protein